MNINKKLALLLALALLVCACGTVSLARGRSLGNQTIVNCKSWVTLRAKPSTSSGSVAQVPLGAVVEAYYYNSQFAECYYRGKHGYILTTYLSNGSSQSASSSSSSYLGKMYVVNCREFVTLRRYASTDAPTVTKVALGQEVDAYYYNGTFTRCFYNGLEGFILSNYLSRAFTGYDYGETYDDSMGTMYIVNCKDWVTLRSRPSTSSGTVARVPLGAAVEAYYYNSEFAECYYKGKHGYILRKYLG